MNNCEKAVVAYFILFLNTLGKDAWIFMKLGMNIIPPDC